MVERMVRRGLALLGLSLGLLFASPARAEGGEARVQVGSKRFTESYILAEIAAALLRSGGDAKVGHEQGLGGTAVTFRALEQGSIDVYPEYTGTIVEAILHSGGSGGPSDLPSLRRALADKKIGISEPLGFNNTYALAVPRERALGRGLRSISDLAKAKELRIGLSPEFLGRSDGWPGLSTRYGLARERASALDHGLAYEAMKNGSIDVTDVYSTDAKIKRFDLQVLADDRRFFPAYEAVLLYREDLKDRAPRAFAELRKLEGRIDEATMIELNSQAEIDGRTFASVGEAFVTGKLTAGGAAPTALVSRRGLLSGVIETIRKEGPRHLGLSMGALLLSVLIGVPLGIVAARARLFGRVLLSATSVVQTIPSLALLCFFIPLLGTGPLPALIALFLYGLLPIARNTVAGIEGIPSSLIESAEALGLPARARLLTIQLPLASRTILAGIKTAAVINVGTATLAAFIGAGGFGAPISTGLNLNDTTLILEGAIPAAALALAAEGLFGLLDRVLIPRGLRLASLSDPPPA
jgi:osmoprotectant transport system permease protein